MTGSCQSYISEIKQFAGLSGPSLRGANKIYWWADGAAEICREVEMKRGRWPKHSTQTRRSLLLSPWDACPYIKMWFGALTGTQRGEAGWEGLGLQCKPQTHSLPPALPSCSRLHYIHSCCVCVCVCVCVCAVCLCRGDSQESLWGSTGWNKSCNASW